MLCNEGVVKEFSPHCDLVRFVIPSHCCQLTHLTPELQLSASYGITGILVLSGDEKPNLRVTSMREPRKSRSGKKVGPFGDFLSEGKFVYLR